MFKKQPLNKGLETKDKKISGSILFVFRYSIQSICIFKSKKRERDTWNAVMTLKPKQLFS